jgi:hypothetical protein
MQDKIRNFRRSVDAAAGNAGPEEVFVTSGPRVEWTGWRNTGEVREGLEETLIRMIREHRSRPGQPNLVPLTMNGLTVHFDARYSRAGHYRLVVGGTRVLLRGNGGEWAAHLLSEPHGHDAEVIREKVRAVCAAFFPDGCRLEFEGLTVVLHFQCPDSSLPEMGAMLTWEDGWWAAPGDDESYHPVHPSVNPWLWSGDAVTRARRRFVIVDREGRVVGLACGSERLGVGVELRTVTTGPLRDDALRAGLEAAGFDLDLPVRELRLSFHKSLIRPFWRPEERENDARDVLDGFPDLARDLVGATIGGEGWPSPYFHLTAPEDATRAGCWRHASPLWVRLQRAALGGEAAG